MYGIRGGKKCKRKTKNKPKHSRLLNAVWRPVRKGGKKKKRDPLIQSAWLKPSRAHGTSLCKGEKSNPSPHPT